MGMDVRDVMLGVLIGALFVGPFIWTELGRRMAIEAVKRGAGVTEAKIKEWLEKGER